MRLTSALLYYVNRQKIPGKITIGKHRARVIVHGHHKYLAAHDMIREHENIQILSTPFLTPEQDAELEKIEEQKVAQQELKDNHDRIVEKMPKHYTTYEALLHLNSTKSWT